MARERMAKLLNYGNFEGRTGHIIAYFMTSQILQHHDINLSYRYLGPWPPDEDLAYTMRSATPRNGGKIA